MKEDRKTLFSGIAEAIKEVLKSGNSEDKEVSEAVEALHEITGYEKIEKIVEDKEVKKGQTSSFKEGVKVVKTQSNTRQKTVTHNKDGKSREE